MPDTVEVVVEAAAATVVVTETAPATVVITESVPGPKGDPGPAGAGGGVPDGGAVGDVLTRAAGGLTAWTTPADLDLPSAILWFDNALI